MIINSQKTIELVNTCDAKYDQEILVDAILWYTEKPTARLKKVFMYGKYPAVAIYKTARIAELEASLQANGKEQGE